MTFDEYQELAIRTARTNFDAPPICNWAMGAAGEAGEAMEIVKKSVYHGHPLDVKALVKEMGDTLWYLAVLADEVGLDLGYIAQRNIAKLRERYPEGFSAEKSINRKEHKQ